MHLHRFFSNTEKSIEVTCNTEKDHTRINYHTAGMQRTYIHMYVDPTILLCSFPCLGVIMGAWPCGIIILLGELFGAESISQVYAFVHTFLQMNSNSTNDIGKNIRMCILIHIY